MCKTLRVLFVGICFSIAWPAFGASLLFDDFNGSSASSLYWHLPVWLFNGDGTFIYDTQFECADNATLPTCVDSCGKITVQTKNIIGVSYYGYDLISNATYQPTTDELVFTVRLKVDQVQPGTIFAFFLYQKPASSDNTNHDEIDFEFLGNMPGKFCTNIYGAEPLGVGHPQYIPYASGTITDWHVYEIRWSATSVKWLVDGTQVRQVTTESPVPPGPMYIHLNAWVPGPESYALAYSPDIPPPAKADETNQTWSMSVDCLSVSSGIQVPTSISASVSSVSLDVGASCQLTAGCLDQDGKPMIAPLSWSSSDSQVATVDQSGKVIANCTGSAEITVSYGSLQQAIPVSVSSKLIKITQVAPLAELGKVCGKVTVNPKQYNVAVLIRLYEGWWTKPYYEKPLTAIKNNKAWSAMITTGGFDSDATEVRAYLIPAGIAPPLASGGEIPPEYSQYEFASVIRTYPAVKKILAKPRTLQLHVGQDHPYVEYHFYVLDDHRRRVFPPYETTSWASADPAIASVDGFGYVTPVAPGNTQIFYSTSLNNSLKGVLNVKVK